jgi:hypothetical protein
MARTQKILRAVIVNIINFNVFGGQMFKRPLEDLSESEGQLLNNTELKIIFGNLPPIYEVHKQMLEELCWATSHWKEDFSIGNVFLKYVSCCVL